jgi:hypothetical protein
MANNPGRGFSPGKPPAVSGGRTYGGLRPLLPELDRSATTGRGGPKWAVAGRNGLQGFLCDGTGVVLTEDGVLTDHLHPESRAGRARIAPARSVAGAQAAAGLGIVL